MSDRSNNDGGGIRIVDRRRFNADGSARAGSGESSPDASSVPQPPAPAPQPQSARADPDWPPQGADSPPIDFLAFAASLATNAMAALGALPPEAGGMPREDPALAREYIDILAMLQDKTQGNLTAQEAEAMQGLLTELRMRYVECTQGRR